MKGPLTRDLTRRYLLSILIAAIAAAVSIVGITHRTDAYGAGAITGVAAGPAGVLVPGFVMQDAFTLGLGVPLLLATVWLAWRGSLIGLLLWLGMLFNVLYTYVHYLVGAPAGILSIAYAALVVLCVYTVASSVARIDADAIRTRIASGIPARVVGGLVVVLALMTIGQDATGALSTAFAQGPHASSDAQRVWVADLTTAAPAMLVGGLLLWRRAALGYVVSAGLCLSFSLFSAELAAMLALEPALTDAAADPGTAVGLLVFALAGLVPLVLIARATPSGQLRATPRAGLAR